MASAIDRLTQQDPVLGMTRKLGGFPSQNVSAITIVGRYGA